VLAHIHDPRGWRALVWRKVPDRLSQNHACGRTISTATGGHFTCPTAVNQLSIQPEVCDALHGPFTLPHGVPRPPPFTTWEARREQGREHAKRLHLGIEVGSWRSVAQIIDATRASQYALATHLLGCARSNEHLPRGIRRRRCLARDGRDGSARHTHPVFACERRRELRRRGPHLVVDLADGGRDLGGCGLP